ncbi:MAG: thioredoxin family protein [Kiritimatiellaeota bacterium]|nr:thioredoxin family protein [Kiritimatiellota bacterium]
MVMTRGFLKKMLTVLNAVVLLTTAFNVPSLWGTPGAAEGRSLPFVSPINPMGPDSTEKPLEWYNDIDAATAKASMEYRPIFIEFFSPACPWCRKLENETLNSPDIKLHRCYMNSFS